MLTYAAKWLNDHPDASKWDQRMALGSALVHVRSLTDFFSGERETKDDLVASHFVSTWPIREVISADDRERVNKYLQHLSQRRTSGVPGWPIWLWTEEIRDVFKEFVERVSAVDTPLAEQLASPTTT